MRWLWTLLILGFVPGVFSESRADVVAERLTEIPSAMEAFVRDDVSCPSLRSPR